MSLADIEELIKEVLDDVFGQRHSSLLRWKDPEGVIRVLCMLEELRGLSAHNDMVTLRGLYYRMASHFKDQAAAVSTLTRITTRLGTSKEALGIIPASKSLVFGGIKIDDEICDIQECHIDQYMATDARIELLGPLLIVEKHSAFDSLVRAYSDERIALFTGRGYPDKAALRFLSRLPPTSRVLYLGDFDPHGLQIWLNYQEHLPFQIWWEAICADDLPLITSLDELMPLTTRDITILNNLIDKIESQMVQSHASFIPFLERVLKQAYFLLQTKQKCEIEAFNTAAFFLKA